MKKKILRVVIVAGIILFAAMSITAIAREKWFTGPRIDLDRAIDVGTVPCNYYAPASFKVRNRGNKALQIHLERISCNCLSIDVDTPTVEPYSSGEFRTEIHSPAYDSNFEADAIISTNDPRMEEIKLNIKGRSVGLIDVFPHSVDFGDIERSEFQPQHFRIFPGQLALKDTLAKVQFQSTTPFLHVSTSLTNGIIEGNVELSQDVPIGVLRGYVKATLKVPFAAVTDIAVVANVIGDCSVKPLALDFGVMSPNSQSSQHVTISPLKAGDIVHILPLPPVIASILNVSHIEAGNVLTISARAASGPTEGVIEGTVRIRIDHATVEKPDYVQVPVLILCRKIE